MSEAKQLKQYAQEILGDSTADLAIDFEGQAFSRAEFNAKALALQSQLISRVGGGGSTIALIAHNHPDCIAAFVAALSHELNVRMVFPFQSSAAIAREIRDIDCEALVAMSSALDAEVLAACRESGKAAICIDEPGRSEGECRAGIERCDELYIEILTSGTTGKPKPFRISQEMVASDMVAKAVTSQQPVLLYFPIGNISGLYTTLPAVLNRMHIVLLERFSLAGWLQFVERYRPSLSGLPPAAIKTLLDADIPKSSLSSIKYMGVGAAPLSPEIQQEFERKYGIPILVSYGATEFGGPVTRLTPEIHRAFSGKKAGNVGQAMPGVQLRVVHPDTGESLAINEIGLLEVISPRVGSEWIRTSDLARIDEDGFLFLAGRADGAIIRGGFKVLPETIESVLTSHPGVSEAAVVGIPEPRLGQVPAAVIVPERGENLNAELLESYARERLLKTHIPARWCFVEELPRTKLSYKVDQGALRELFLAD